MDMKKYLDIFTEEALENLEAMNNLLIRLEQEDCSDEEMNEAYRIVHTIKGNANTLGITQIGEIAHAMEDLFDIVRKEKKSINKDACEVLFESLDIIEKMTKEILRDGKISSDGKQYVEKIRLVLEKDFFSEEDDATSDTCEDTACGERETEKGKAIIPENKEKVLAAISDGKEIYEIVVGFSIDARFKEGRAFQFSKAISGQGKCLFTIPDIKGLKEDTKQVGFIIAAEKEPKNLESIANDFRGLELLEVNKFTLEEEKSGAQNTKRNTIQTLDRSETIRVKSKLLDQLLDLVGETMISNIRIKQISVNLKNRELNQLLKNNERLMGELQDTVLRMRMVPVDQIFKRFPRMVRDMARERNKEIDFAIIGNDIEIDRSLLDEVGDILVHILRNSVDHGIETEEERVRSGKPTRGSLTLRAYRDQSNIVIRVEDDGRGFSFEKILNKAVEKGMLTKKEAEDMDERRIPALAFLPGISTADRVTDVSGRGVGLDVVKTKVESMGGAVKLDTAPGAGSTITMKLPPSMSIIRVMLIDVNNEKYAIPLENIRETTKISASDIHDINEKSIFKLRDEILPVIDIHREFGGAVSDTGEDLPALIVEKDDVMACLIVSKLIGQQEIVVKNMGQDIKTAKCFSGATILGDGKVAMILDVGAFL